MFRRFASTLDKYYQTLELKPGASADEIKTAFNRLVKKYHPDSTHMDDKKQATEKFKQVHEAKSMLLSPNPKDSASAESTSEYSSKEYEASAYKSYEDFKKHFDEREKYKEEEKKKKRQESKTYQKSSEDWSAKAESYNERPGPQSNNTMAMLSLLLTLMYILFNLRTSSSSYRNAPVSKASLAPSPSVPAPAPAPAPVQTYQKPIEIVLSAAQKKLTAGKNLEYMYRGQSGQHKRFTLLSAEDNQFSVFKCNTCHAVVTRANLEDHVEYYKLEHLKRSKDNKVNSK